MSGFVNLIAFGTLGNPNGFRQTHFIGNKNHSNGIKTFDLNTNAITLFPKGKVYGIRKEWIGGQDVLSYCVYEYAKEPRSDRSGTFIGSAVLLTGKKAEESLILRILNSFQRTLYRNNVVDDVITVDHSDLFSVTKPKDFDRLAASLTDIDDLYLKKATGRSLVYYCKTDPQELSLTLKKALCLLNAFDNIYFTANQEVATYVYQKNIFELVEKEGFDREIQLVEAEKSRLVEAYIVQLENERQILEADQRDTLGRFILEINGNAARHQENERSISASRRDLERIRRTYAQFSNNLQELIRQLKTGKNLFVAQGIYLENKSIFTGSMDRIKEPALIESQARPKARSGISERPSGGGHSVQIGDDAFRNPTPHTKKNYPFRRHRKLDLFKIISLILFLLWIGTILYFKSQMPDTRTHPPHPQTVPARVDDSILQIQPF